MKRGVTHDDVFRFESPLVVIGTIHSNSDPTISLSLLVGQSNLPFPSFFPALKRVPRVKKFGAMWKILFLLLGSCRAFLPSSQPPGQRLHKKSALTAQKRPALIVFDLDATLWTPELYQLRQRRRNADEETPRAHVDVQLYPGAREALEWLAEHNNNNSNNANDKIALAVASRTKSVDWAFDLLDQFDLTHRFVDLQIFSGDKQTHFRNLQRNTGIAYNQMLFFDDARDGRYGNCVPVSELGVLTCHVPGGLASGDIFHRALDCFDAWDAAPNTIIEWDGRVTQWNKSENKNGNERQTGRVKKVLYDKGYGFVEYTGDGSNSRRDLFFHFNDLPVGATQVQQGDEMTFTVGQNKGKPLARNIEITTSQSSSTTSSQDQVTMRAFSMNLPFAALLANGYKDLETRNGTMFVPYEPGTQFLLHVGQRTYPDGDRHLEIMQSGGLSDQEIADLKSLPPGFGKGMAVAIVEIGETYETTVEQRSDPNMQRRIGAYGADSGMRCTEIRRVAYLKKPVPVKAQGGVFKVTLDRDAIPDGWISYSSASSSTAS